MRWSEEVTCQFVKFYLKHECLWNSDHDDYRTKQQRFYAYRDIISEFKASTGISMNEGELTTKIRSLKSTYAQEIVKMKKRSTSDRPYRPNIKWFKEWDTCFGRSKEAYNVNSTIEDDKSSTVMDNPAEEDSQGHVWVLNNTDGSQNTNPFPGNDYNVILKLEPNENSQQKEESRSKFKMKRAKLNKWSPSTDYSTDTFRGSMDLRDDQVKEDEFDIYGKYIASQLKKMSVQNALKLQLKIQSMVSEARLLEMQEEAVTN